MITWFGRLAAVSLLSMVAFASQEAERPNVLWITTEDNSPCLGCYGDKLARTPNLDKLAGEGVLYTNAFANNPVCAPARFTLITGVTAQKMGTVHMRSRYRIPGQFKPYPDYLREAGYYCTNHRKGDYNHAVAAGHDDKLWDDGGKETERFAFLKRKPGQPFFGIINLTECHESAQKRIRAFAIDKVTDEQLAAVTVPPYMMDNRQTRFEWLKFYHSMTLTDAIIGEILETLEKEGVAEDTIVFYYGDHGGPLPRGKRYIYETGTRVPLIIKFPEKYQHLAPAKPGSRLDRLVSFVDFAPSLLSLLDIPVPETMEGTPFLGKQVGPEPEYVFLARGRMDSAYDPVRAVRDRKFRYVRNYLPQRPIWQPVAYAEKLFPSLQEFRKAYEEGKCDKFQRTFWEPKAGEELYDVANDPWEVNNLAQDPEYQDVLERLRAVNAKRVRDLRDPCLIPEGQMEKHCERELAPYDWVRQDGFPMNRIIETAEMASSRDASLLPELMERMRDPNESVRYWAASGCVALREKASSAKDVLENLLKDEDADVRIAAAEALCVMGEDDLGMPVLIKTLDVSGKGAGLHLANVFQQLDRKILKKHEDALRAVKSGKWAGKFLAEVLESLR